MSSYPYALYEVKYRTVMENFAIHYHIHYPCQLYMSLILKEIKKPKKNTIRKCKKS
jgi:hypothetical protein